MAHETKKRVKSRRLRLSDFIYRRFLWITLLSALSLMVAVLIAISFFHGRVEKTIDRGMIALAQRVLDTYFQTMIEEQHDFLESVEHLASEVRNIEALPLPESLRDRILISNLSIFPFWEFKGIERLSEDSWEAKYLNEGDHYSLYYFRPEGLFAKVYLRLPGEILVVNLAGSRKVWKNILNMLAEQSKPIELLKGFAFYDAMLETLTPEIQPLSEEDKKYLKQSLESGELVHIDREGLHSIYTSWSYTGEYYGFEPLGIVIKIDTTFFNLFTFALASFFAVVIFIVVFLISKRSKRIAFQIARPFDRLVESMNRFRSTGFLELDEPQEDCEILEVHELSQNYRELAEEVVSSFQEIKAMNEELQDSYQKLRELNERLEQTYLGFARQLAVIAEGYDEITGNHIERVGKLSGFIARKLGLGEEFSTKIEHFAPLHDIGKIMIPKEILNKPFKLDDEEFEKMKKHTIYGAALLGDDEYFTMARNICLYHHEKWNGRGYPFGLKENEIPVEAAIVALVDVYDALRSHRPYKEPVSHEEAVRILTVGDARTRPDDFSPEVLRVFMENESEIAALWDTVTKEEKESSLSEKVSRILIELGALDHD